MAAFKCQNAFDIFDFDILHIVYPQSDLHVEAAIHFQRKTDQETMLFDSQQVQMVHKAFTSADRNSSLSWEEARGDSEIRSPKIRLKIKSFLSIFRMWDVFQVSIKPSRIRHTACVECNGEKKHDSEERMGNVPCFLHCDEDLASGHCSL